MKKFFMIVGIIVVLWLVLGLVGSLLGWFVKTVFWVAVVAGIAYIVATFVMRKKVGNR